MHENFDVAGRRILRSREADQSLLYAAAADSDGTFGGIVELGKPEHLGRLLR